MPSVPAARISKEQLVEDVSSLVSPPQVCVQLFELARSKTAGAQRIGQLVALDPNLSARLLRIVNSAYFGFPSRIASISRAVAIIGTNDLCNLALAIAAVRPFSAFGGGPTSLQRFWQHSIVVALLARRLALRLGFPRPERFFLAGLLHDVGIPIMYSQIQDLAHALAPSGCPPEADLARLEREHLGFDHAGVGALLLERWQLPDMLWQPVGEHHDEDREGKPSRETAILRLADGIAGRCELGALGMVQTSPGDDAAAWAALGTTPEAVDEAALVEDASEQLSEIAGTLLG